MKKLGEFFFRILADGIGHEVGVVCVLVGVQRVGGVGEFGGAAGDEAGQLVEERFFALPEAVRRTSKVVKQSCCRWARRRSDPP